MENSGVPKRGVATPGVTRVRPDMGRVGTPKVRYWAWANTCRVGGMVTTGSGQLGIRHCFRQKDVCVCVCVCMCVCVYFWCHTA